MRRRLLDNRLLLLLGFGGLLTLLPLMSYRANLGLTDTERRSDAVRTAYLHRNHLLNDLRSNIVLSGTYLRDYLLDTDSGLANLHLSRLRQSLLSVEDSLERPELSSGGAVYAEFLRQYRTYSSAIHPVLSWDPVQRNKLGYRFLRDEFFPRRTEMLRLTDQISRWNEQQLNDGVHATRVLNLEVRDQLRLQVLVFLAAGMLLAAFVYSRITRLENDASLRYEEAESARSESKQLSAQLVSAQEEERKRISRELHDEVAQSISAQLLIIKRLGAKLAPELRGFLDQDLKELKTVTESSLRATRNISLLLRPSMLDDLGLVAALNWLCRECTRHSSVKVFMETESDLDALDEQHNICVYRVVQEALNNALVHGSASEVKIRVSLRDGRISLSVQDDGKGFEVSKHRGMGTLGMAERIEKLGGRLKIESELQVGTVVLAEIP